MARGGSSHGGLIAHRDCTLHCVCVCVGLCTATLRLERSSELGRDELKTLRFVVYLFFPSPEVLSHRLAQTKKIFQTAGILAGFHISCLAEWRRQTEGKGAGRGRGEWAERRHMRSGSF